MNEPDRELLQKAAAITQRAREQCVTLALKLHAESAKTARNRAPFRLNSHPR